MPVDFIEEWIKDAIHHVSRSIERSRNPERWRNQLAEEFGKRRKWKHSRKSFTLYQLSVRSLKTGYEGFDSNGDGLIDHPYWYREPWKPHRPAAVAVHLYDWRMSDIELGCEKLNLNYEVVTDFPSWWYPGQTQLILYTPREQ